MDILHSIFGKKKKITKYIFYDSYACKISHTRTSELEIFFMHHLYLQT